jgi:hypothetical protein
MRKPLIFILFFCLTSIALWAAEENEQISRFERAALNRESSAEAYRLDAEQKVKDSDFLANRLAPSATNSELRAFYVDSAGSKYEKAGDLMVMARRQYQLALTNWGSAEREYRLWEDAELKVARAVSKASDVRMEAFRCAGLASEYFEAGALHYGDANKFEKQGACFSKASLILEEIAKERARPVRKKTVVESPPAETGGAR